jgi:thioredoxin 1
MELIVKTLIVSVVIATAAFAYAGEDETSGPLTIHFPETVTTPTLKIHHPQKATLTPQKQKLWTLKEFGSNRCIPCKKMKPVLVEITNEYKGVLKVEILEIKEHLEESKKYGVMLIPTQVLLDPKGNAQWKHVGFIPKEDLESVLHEKGIKKPEKQG